MAVTRRRPSSFRQAIFRFVVPLVLLGCFIYPWLHYPWTCPPPPSDGNTALSQVINTTSIERPAEVVGGGLTQADFLYLRYPQLKKQDDGAARLATFSKELEYSQLRSKNDFVVHMWRQKTPDLTQPKVLLASASAPTCEMLHGPVMAQQALINKLAYAELHTNVDVLYTLENPAKDAYQWNRPLLWLRLLKKWRSSYDWVFWVDADAIILDLGFTIPFASYKPYDIVMWGNTERAYSVGDFKSIALGLTMFKTSQFSISFVDAILDMRDKGRRLKAGDLYEQIQTAITEPPQFLNDQAAAAYLFRTVGAERWRERVHFETSYYLNGYWKDVGQRLDKIAFEREIRSKDPPFSCHFVGCSLCTGRAMSDYKQCVDYFEKSFQFAMNETARKEMAAAFREGGDAM
ncbi:hypothetical protein CBR_g34633 [Chara braunii]|uniref:GT34-family glycosyltransferase n=1 Tax=Chara braunii TaxID=69332 RepID=A0A388LJ52_CHABU|nr:hypothetical protein CBR_g34633 [Chara braunii]|eukprot:GBG82349.1 hypothetical protein CBR_g34633 [Chara braunii]